MDTAPGTYAPAKAGGRTLGHQQETTGHTGLALSAVGPAKAEAASNGELSVSPLLKAGARGALP